MSNLSYKIVNCVIGNMFFTDDRLRIVGKLTAKTLDIVNEIYLNLH